MSLLGKTTGEMAIKILKGEAKVSEMAIQYAPEATKEFNADKCAQLGITAESMTAKGYTAIN